MHKKIWFSLYKMTIRIKLLQNYYPTGYQKALNSLQNISPPKKEENARHDVIFNNIFGNSNPNKASAYPKYGKIKK